MLNLNDESIRTEGGNFDPSKIFGYDVVEKVDNVDTITSLLEGVVISGFGEIGTSSTGSKFWDIQLTDSKGNTYNLREFDIDQAREGWEKKQASQLKRLKHVLSKFVPEGTPLPQAADFPALWLGVQALLTANACNTKPVRLKLIYNNKGYLATPAYVPFMELASVPVEQSGLKLNPDFDTLIRPQADKPAGGAAAPAAAGAGVPFKFG
jgi:hypothetical protein